MPQPKNIDAQGAGEYIASNISNLRYSPVFGVFDETHLKRIHERIFYGFTESRNGIPFHPGRYRAEIKSEDGDWCKYRRLESIEETSVIVYSRTGKADISHLRKTLDSANPMELAKLAAKEFVAFIGNIYAHLDYIHPFEEGNSRTLREFTRQLAMESGYQLDWDIFNRSSVGGDILYIARDLSVNRISLSNGISSLENERDVFTTIEKLKENRDLQTLLYDAVRPLECSL